MKLKYILLTILWLILTVFYLMSIMGCSMFRTPKNFGLDNSDILVSSGAVQINITVKGKIEKGAINNTFNLIVSSGAFQTYLDRVSLFGGKEVSK